MKIEDIKPGKKYYAIIATNAVDKQKAMKRRTVQTYYVLEKDSSRVCASLNKGPAQWYGKSKYARWVVDKINL